MESETELLHQALEKLRESEERFRGAFAAATVGMALVALDGRWLEVNHAIREILGYSEAELLVSRYQAITHPDDMSKDAAHVRRMLAGGTQSCQLEKRFFHKSGRVIDIDLSVSLVRDASRQPLYFVAIIQDITARKDAQQDREQFFGNSTTPMCVCGYDGYVKSFNPALQDIFGQSSEELLTEPFIHRVHPDDRQRAELEIELLLKGGPRRNIEVRSLCQDGTYRWTAWDAVPCPEKQTFYAIGHDVTDRHHAEHALAEAERFSRSTLDALGKHIAVLDETGLVLATNRAWREFAIANSADTDVGVGVNYLEVCDRATGPYAASAATAAAGIRAVIGGDQAGFTMEYPCHSPSENRWFIARISRFTGPGPTRVVISHDNITAAKTADQERQKFVSLADNSIDFIALATLSGDAIYLNPAGYEVAGLTQDIQRTATKISDFYTETGERQFREVNLPAVMNTGHWKGEVQFQNFTTNRPVEMDASTFMVRDPENGEPLCLAIVARDITQRKRAEKELRESEARWRAVTLSAMDAILIADQNGRIVTWNNGAEATFGYTEDDVIGEPLEVLMPERYRAAHRAGMALVKTTGKSRLMGKVLELHGLRKNGTEFPLELLLSTWQSGTETFYSGNLRDITERKQKDSELSRARTQLMDAIDNLDAGLVMYGPDERLVVCNSKYKEIYAASGPLMVPGTPYETILRDFAASGIPDLSRTSADEWVALRLAAHRNPGRTSEQSLANRWIRIDDHRTSDGGVVSLRTDITSLKEAQEAADSANRAKSEFLANMSHEIRTPMNGIIGFTDLVLDTNLSDEQQQYVEAVKTSGESLLRIINDILDFSKIEAGRLDLEMIDFDLRESLTNTVKTMALRAHEKGLELLCDVQPDVPDNLVGDPTRLWQVIINLVGNAIKFTSRGEISVLVETQELAAETATLRFTIRDTGIGVPADRLLSIFQPFVQADSTMTRKFGGTGLGLTITSKLVEMMGGRIWVESEEGQGSKFHFSARFGRRSAPLVKRGAARRRDMSGLRVLIVDDNANNRRILLGVLGHWRMDAAEANGGGAALEALHAAAARSEPFDLILLDLVMPGIDGFQVLEEIRREPEIDRPAILMISSDNQRGAVARCKELGAAAYLIKPIRPSELLIAIENALQDSRHQLHVSPEAAPSPPSVEPAHRRLRILITEDNQINQKLAVRTLEKAGHSTAVASNGEEALALLAREQFDLVLMDVQMPVMDGFQATARIRQQELGTGQRLPIVAMTAHAIKGDQERCLEAGMDGYVPKPIQVHHLFSVIAAVTAGISEHATVPRIGS